MGYSFHIEPTNKCVIECSACARTIFKKKFPKIKQVDEINVDELCNFLGDKTDLVDIEGVYGDAIYHSKILELIERLKKKNIRIKLTTNASGKRKDFWIKLESLLSSNDTITFSIDGLEDTNSVYRKNSKWDTIVPALEIFGKSKIKTLWKFIVFQHNEHQIDEARALSKKLGIDDFILVKSHRHFDDDYDVNLIPSNNYVDNSVIENIDLLDKSDSKAKMRPQCLTKKTWTLIDCHGNIHPCCYMGTLHLSTKTIWNPNRGKFNIKNNTIEDVFNNQEVKQFYESTKDLKTANRYCKMFCGVKNG
jgi:MoaA/NifB/PqqE/SkfB family radical SAM enzyme